MYEPQCLLSFTFGSTIWMKSEASSSGCASTVIAENETTTHKSGEFPKGPYLLSIFN